MDSAFFSDEIIGSLDAQGVEYTVSVPFERFAEFKKRIEARRWSWGIEAGCAYFEAQWKPKVWETHHRFLFIRTRVKQHYKEPVQLDLFTLHQFGYEFKVILTNKCLSARKVLTFHNGRGAQEGLFAELKSGNQLDYAPTRTWVGNQIYLLSVLLAYNGGEAHFHDPGLDFGVFNPLSGIGFKQGNHQMIGTLSRLAQQGTAFYFTQNDWVLEIALRAVSAGPALGSTGLQEAYQGLVTLNGSVHFGF